MKVSYLFVFNFNNPISHVRKHFVAAELMKETENGIEASIKDSNGFTLKQAAS